MNWNTIVEHLGWHDVVSKWEHQEDSPETKNHPDHISQHDESKTVDIKEFQRTIDSSDLNLSTLGSYVKAFGGNKDQMSKKPNTNPFLNDNEEVDTDLDSAVENALKDDMWFYLDPDECTHGPFQAVEMATWYDSGYFEGSLRVRKAVEHDYMTIDDLIAKKSQEMFSTFSLSDHVPLEYIQRVTAMINPFCEANRTAKHDLSTCDRQKKGGEHIPEKYSFDISQGMKKLALKSTNADCKEQTLGRAPIKFSLAGPKSKKEIAEEPRKSNQDSSHLANKSLVAKMDKLQKYWQDVAMTKLAGPKKARHVQIELMGEVFDAVLEPESRVSCLGAGAVNFLEYRMISFTRYRNGSRALKSEHGTNVTIAGHVNLSVAFRNITVPDFKMLLVPDLEYFIYLGLDFKDSFMSKEVVLPPGLNCNRVSNDLCRFSRELKPTKYSVMRRIEELFPDLYEEGLGLTNLEEHSIDISSSSKPFQTPVVLSKENPLALKLLDNMIACDIVEDSASPWRLAVLPVCDGKQESLRLDLRRINAMTLPDVYAVPSKTKTLEQLQRSNYISSIELSFIDWQIPLHSESRKYTSFEMNGRCYQLKRMNAGMKNGRKRIRRLIDKILPRHQYALVATTLIIFSRDFEPHTEQLAKVAQKLRESGVKVNISQSSFCSRAINCFGFVVGSDAQELDQEAWKAISSIPCPKTKQRLKTFLQILEWYRVLIPGFDQAAAPLLLLSKSKSETLCYTSDAREAFAHMKRLLVGAAAQFKPDFRYPFYVQCNVNFEIIAGLLYQVDESGRYCPIAYCVKELSKAQQQFAVTELECLAVVTCLKVFQPYIEDEKFVVVTDKSILTWILAEDQLSLRLLRWCMALQTFDFSVEQRQQVFRPNRNVLNQVDSALVTEIQSSLRKTIGTACPACKLLGQNIKTFPHAHLDHKVEKDLVYCRREFSCGDAATDKGVWKLFVSEAVARSLAQRVHIDSFGHHRSRNQMHRYLSSEFYWPEMMSDVQKVLRNCQKCRGIP